MEANADDLRARLIDRIRTDDAFAEALKADPIGPIEDSDMADDFARLDRELYEELTGNKLPEHRSLSADASPQFSNKCCISAIVY
jgi:hypothetical protein